MRSRLRNPSAFSMAEVVMVFVVLGILMAFSYVSLAGVENKVENGAKTTEMRELAGSLSLYQQSRGYFPVDMPTVRDLEPHIDVTDGPATAAGVIAVGTGTVSGVEVLGLATMDDAGSCLTLRYPPFGSEIEESRGKFVPSDAQPCTSASATQVTGNAW